MGEHTWKSSQRAPEPVHQPGTPKGEGLIRRRGREAGYHKDKEGGRNRPASKASGRSSSGVASSNPIDPNSPYIQTP